MTSVLLLSQVVHIGVTEDDFLAKDQRRLIFALITLLRFSITSPLVENILSYCNIIQFSLLQHLTFHLNIFI